MDEAAKDESPSLTPEQRQAVVTRAVSVLLSSGAGCGKTHVLTERYLSHLRDDGAGVNEIVAITFTDRAAREMRARIRQAVVANLRAAPTEEQAEIWSRHLRDLETASITTFHSFCGTLLRQFPFDALLDPGFEILEEVLSVNLESEALDETLQKLLTSDTQPGKDLRQLVLLYGWQPVVTSVRGLMHNRDESAWRTWLADTDVVQKRAECVGHLLPRLIEHRIHSRPKIVRCVDLLGRYPTTHPQMAAQVALILDELPKLAQTEDLESAIEALHEAAKVGRIGAKAWPDKDVYEQIKKAFEDFRAELKSQKYEEFTAETASESEAVEVGQRFLRVALEVDQAYAVKKRLNRVVDFQDLLLLTRDLLRDRADIRATLQGRYRFLLVDELQDTDPIQMEVISYLCGGGLTAGKLFAVGDQNQSIYRFRGAEVRLFQQLRQQIAHDGRLHLTLNFRSQPAILDFTNALVGPALVDFEPLRAHAEQESAEPSIEFLWAHLQEKVTVAKARAVEAEWIARRIMKLKMDGVPRVREKGVGLRPARLGDIVLLFRAMTSVQIYEEALRKCGIDYYLVGGRAFFAQQEIYDILNLLRSLENPQDSLSLAGLLRSPFCCLSDESLFVLARHPDGLWTGLNDTSLDARLPETQRPTVSRARRQLAGWRAVKDRLPIARLLGTVLADSGYDAALRFEFLGERKLANLWKLLDLARRFDRTNLFGIAEFIDRLGDLVQDQAREDQAATMPENADVVRIMSIHQAKGLEFPIVFIPDMNKSAGASFPPVAQWDAEFGCIARPPADEEPPPFSSLGWRLWEAREEIEEWNEDLRTLYVACTRARDLLVLSASMGEELEAKNAWMQVLSKRFDLGSGASLEGKRTPQVRVWTGTEPEA